MHPPFRVGSRVVRIARSSSCIAWVALAAMSARAAAADRSGVRPEVLSIPSGPGSIEGLGEGFEPSLQGGSASFSLAIRVPPGVAGLVPAVRLSYATGGGNGELGPGWSLGLPSVQRGTDRRLPTYDASDVFVLRGGGRGGAEELIAMPDGSYRHRIEGAFVRGLRRADGTWELQAPSGRTSFFGQGEARVEEGDRVFAWLLSRELDIHGNQIVYQHERDATGRPYLARVVYSDFSAAVRNEVVFAYEDRPDVVTSYLPTFATTTARRLARIEVRHGGELVFTYALRYDKSQGLSRLTEVGLTAADGTALPPLRLAYAEPQLSSAGVITMVSAPARALGPLAELDDVNGDSLADLLVMDSSIDGGRYSVHANLDGSRFAARELLASSPSVWLSTAGVQLADMDGDAAADVVAKVSSSADGFRYYPSSGPGTGGFAATAVTITPNPSFALDSPDVRLVDLDHDRRTDWLRIDPSTGLAFAAFNRGGGEFSPEASLGRLDPDEVLSFSSGLRLADMNGDGLSDLVAVRSGSVRHWPGRGRGAFDQERSWTGAPVLSDIELAALHVRDVTGDGLADLVHVGVSQVRVWRNQSGDALAAAITVSGTPSVRPDTTVRVADMNGNGAADIVWVTPTRTDAPWQYLDLLGDGGPGLITRIDSGLGKLTTIDYAGLGEMRAWARESDVPWTRRCPVGQMVVARIEVDDGLGARTTTELRYADPYFDGATREFRGFGRAVRIDVGDAEQPTLVTDSQFDLGDEDEARKGLVVSRTRRGEGGAVFDEVVTTYTVRDVGSAAGGAALRYAFASREETRVVEGQPAARLLRTEWDRDARGNLILEVQHGEVGGDGDGSIGDDERTVERAFAAAPAAGPWVLGRVAVERVLDAGGRRLAETRTYYDGEVFVGLPLGEVMRGAPTRVETWIEADRFALQESFERDGHGNVIHSRDGRGGLVTMVYGEDHTFLTEVRTQVTGERSLSWSVDFDRRLGTMTRLTDPDGAVRRFRYDGLGRPIALIEPGDSDTLPTRSFEYHLGAPLSRVRSETREKSGQLGAIVQHTYTDGLGRARGTFEEAPDQRWAALELARYGARGWPDFIQHPRFEPSADPVAADPARGGVAVTYDALGRKREETEVDGARRRWEYLPLAAVAHDEDDLDPASPHVGTPSTHHKDGLGRIRRVVELDGGREVITRYDHDALGNLIAVTDPRGVMRRYELDGRSRQTAVIEPNSGRWTTAYDDGDALVTREDPMGNRVSWTRDLLGRPVEERQQPAGESHPRMTVRYHHDESAAAQPSLARVAGRLAWVEDEAGAIYFGYDERGRLSRRLRRWSDGTEHLTSTEYDAAGRAARRGFPDATYLAFEYDGRGHLRSAGGLMTDATWTPDARLDCARFGNGVQDCRTYDDRLRLSRMNAIGPSGQVLRDLTLVRDAASHIRAIVDERRDMEPLFDLSAEYEHDARNRLVRATDRVAETTWRHDDVGNLEAVASGHDHPALNAEHRYGESGAGPDQLTSVGETRLRYDEAGRLMEDGERRLTWDAKGRLTRVVRGDTVEEYVYDFEDGRALKTTRTGSAASQVVRYIDRDVEERDGQLVRYFFFDAGRAVRLPAATTTGAGVAVPAPARKGDSSYHLLSVAAGALLLLLGLAAALLARSRQAHAESGRSPRAEPALLALLPLLAVLSATCGGTSRAAQDGTAIDTWPETATLELTDHQASVVASVDAAGQVIVERAYHPYGMVRAARGTASPHLYVGNERDHAVGLDDFRARGYQSAVARFLSIDPVALAPDDPGQAAQPAYAYTFGNPIDSADPDGRSCRGISCGISPDATREERDAVREAQFGDLESAAIRTAAAISTLDELVSDTVSAFEWGLANVTALLPCSCTKDLPERAAENARDRRLAVAKRADARFERLGNGGVARGTTANVRGCFVAGTLVATPEGLVPIEQIQVGDIVLSRDEQTGETRYDRVTATFVRQGAEIVEVLVTGESGESEVLQTTAEHPFWVEGRGWVKVGDLHGGSRFLARTGHGLDLKTVTSNGRLATVYNIEVGGAHTYFVGALGTWVHNKARMFGSGGDSGDEQDRVAGPRQAWPAD